MQALLSHLETPASHWFRYVYDTWLKMKLKDMLGLTDFSLNDSENRLGQTVSCNSNDYQSNTYITISFLVKNNVYVSISNILKSANKSGCLG